MGRRPPFLHLVIKRHRLGPIVISFRTTFGKGEPQPNEGGSVSGNLTWNRVSPGWDTTRKSPPCR